MLVPKFNLGTSKCALNKNNHFQHQRHFEVASFAPLYKKKILSKSCKDIARRIVSETLLLNEKTLGFLASGGEEFNPGPETRLDCSELLCNQVLLKYKGDRESF